MMSDDQRNILFDGIQKVGFPIVMALMFAWASWTFVERIAEAVDQQTIIMQKLAGTLERSTAVTKLNFEQLVVNLEQLKINHEQLKINSRQIQQSHDLLKASMERLEAK